MSYNKKIWKNGDLITKEGMNNIEDGIYDAHKEINTLKNNTPTGGSNINDTTASATTTYSSNKIETIKENLSSQYENIANKFEFRKFKPAVNSSPKFYSDDSTAPLGKRLYTLTKVEENLNKLKLLHVDSITFVIHVYKTSETELTPLETPEFLSQVYEICQRLNIKITALKFHQPTSLTGITSMTDFNTVYKNLISEYLVVAENISTIEYVTVFNEMNEFYGNVANHAYIIELYNLVKANGYKTGITLSLEDRNLMGSECDPLFTNSDAIFLNFYPILAYDLDVLNHQQMIDSVNYQLIKVLKYHKYNKPLILSECGCSDKDLALASPSKWGWSETGAVDSNGKSPYLFFKSIFNSEVNSGDISEMWLWFDYCLHYDFIYELFREFLSNK